MVNHVGGYGNGRYHSYRRLLQPAPAPSPVSLPSQGRVRVHTHHSSGLQLYLQAKEMRMGLPDLNEAIPSNAEDSECTLRETDQLMPIANVIRIMREILPCDAKIYDDSKVTIQECVSEFISFVTGKANVRCQHEQRKTVTAEDMLWAMSKFGFDDYIEPLTLYLHRYRGFDGEERGSLRRESLLLRRPVGVPSVGCSIMPYNLPPKFRMAHHHGYFVYPSRMGNNYMQGDTSNGSTSRYAMAAEDSEVESPAKEGKE